MQLQLVQLYVAPMALVLPKQPMLSKCSHVYNMHGMPENFEFEPCHAAIWCHCKFLPWLKMCHLLLDSQTYLSSQHFQLPVSCPWVQHTVLKFVLSTTMLQTCVPNHICQPCCIFLACSAKLCTKTVPWRTAMACALHSGLHICNAFCLAGATTKRWWGMVNTAKWLPTMLQFLSQAPPNPAAPAQPAKAGPPDQVAWNLVSKHQKP